jgi:drug/metabolite transporter (DMT)-like permease
VTLGSRVLLFTAVALLAFAGNSLLARAALAPGAGGEPAIGAVAFTALRLAAGALVLVVLAGPRTLGPSGTAIGRGRAAFAAIALVLYALPFSVAYLDLGAATGALLLFGTVQVSMGAVGHARGERLDGRARMGWAVALLGLGVLLLPGVRAPEPWAAAAMIVAGVAWAAYSLAGRGERAALAATARNFVWTLPVAAVLAAWPGAWSGATVAGAGLAITSGAVTSGLGYAAWYVALPSLSRSAAAVVQLAVPVVAALGAVALLGEALDGRLLVAGVLVLGGIAAVVAPRGRARDPR